MRKSRGTIIRHDVTGNRSTHADDGGCGNNSAHGS